MTVLKKYGEKDNIDPGKDLAEKTLEYIEKHPHLDYQTASDIVFKKNLDIARAYSEGQEIEKRKEAKTAYEEEMNASAEL